MKIPCIWSMEIYCTVYRLNFLISHTGHRFAIQWLRIPAQTSLISAQSLIWTGTTWLSIERHGYTRICYDSTSIRYSSTCTLQSDLETIKNKLKHSAADKHCAVFSFRLSFCTLYAVFEKQRVPISQQWNIQGAKWGGCLQSVNEEGASAVNLSLSLFLSCELRAEVQLSFRSPSLRLTSWKPSRSAYISHSSSAQCAGRTVSQSSNRSSI